MSREMYRQLPWPFEGDRFPPALGAVVQRTVLEGDLPALVQATRAATDRPWVIGRLEWEPEPD